MVARVVYDRCHHRSESEVCFVLVDCMYLQMLSSVFYLCTCRRLVVVDGETCSQVTTCTKACRNSEIVYDRSRCDWCTCTLWA